jgi:MFS family permease
MMVFEQAVVVAYYLSKGLDYTAILTLQSVSSTVMVLLEVPSGYLADRFGRKFCLVSGLAAYICLLLGLLWSTSFWQFALCMVATGTALSLISGADTALAMDSYGQAKLDEYGSFEVDYTRGGALGMSIALTVGGLVILVSGIKVLFVLRAIAYAVALILAITLVEPPRPHRHQLRPWRTIYGTARHMLHAHVQIKWLVMYGVAISFGSVMFYWLCQPAFQRSGVPLKWYGPLYLAMSVPVLWLAGKLDYVLRWGQQRVMYLLLGISLGCAAILAVDNPWLTIGGLVVSTVVVQSFFFQLQRRQFNTLLADEPDDNASTRATALSVNNLVQRLAYVAAGPTIGKLADSWSWQAGLLALMVYMGAIGGVAIIKLRHLRPL